jgi:tRNA-dihydrouridine synthase
MYMANLWRDLPPPIFALAPMEDVTDTVFRRIVASAGRPDVMFTEFIHTEVVLARRGRRPGLTPRLVHSRLEHPLVAQIWGNDPDSYARASVRLAELGFAGVDINMGCPVRKIRRKGACSGLILRPDLAAELIAAAKAGGLPVSVKTRIGYDRPQTEQWISHLLDQELDALTVHGRYAEQESEEPADWDHIGHAARLRDRIAPQTVLLGNGDVRSRAQGRELALRYRLDGVMIGRGVFDDPRLFSPDCETGSGFLDADEAEKLEFLLRHVRLYRATWGETRNYEILKKFYKIYLVGFPGADELRDRLNATATYHEAFAAIEAWRERVPAG